MNCESFLRMCKKKKGGFLRECACNVCLDMTCLWLSVVLYMPLCMQSESSSSSVNLLKKKSAIGLYLVKASFMCTSAPIRKGLLSRTSYLSMSSHLQ
ncbi:hypothetical protein CSUI_010962 [Cystoisospora suis]|uniref:Uncharacterized protein n=1 Tax=Cystoisospora suis TaxID=483139 RepID=A0A2C6KBE6_9APIC|nr:hypothetical protein CSUI_010962 [Cystoisospora suis]